MINCLLGKTIFETPNLESTSTICKLRNSRRINIITKTDKGEDKKDLTDICNLSTKKGVEVFRETLDEVTNVTFTQGHVQSVDVGFPIPFLKVSLAFKEQFTNSKKKYLCNIAIYVIFCLVPNSL